MKAVIDSSSLLAMVRYYLPFDEKAELLLYVKDRIEDGSLIVIDKVLDECRYIAGGMVLRELPFLQDKDFLKSAKAPYVTTELIAPAPAKFLRQVENQFVVSAFRKKLSEAEFEVEKDRFLKGADIKQIILCLSLLADGEQVVLVSEETEGANDNKLFKKIPAMCRELSIETTSLPLFFRNIWKIGLSFTL